MLLLSRPGTLQLSAGWMLHKGTEPLNEPCWQVTRTLGLTRQCTRCDGCVGPPYTSWAPKATPNLQEHPDAMSAHLPCVSHS